MRDYEVQEGEQHQTSYESMVYKVTTTPWGSSPTNADVDVFIDDTGEDVTATVIPSGTPTVNGDEVTLPPIKNLTKGYLYRVVVKFTSNGSIFSAVIYIRCEV